MKLNKFKLDLLQAEQGLTGAGTGPKSRYEPPELFHSSATRDLHSCNSRKDCPGAGCARRGPDDGQGGITMAPLTRAEQETIVIFNEEEPQASVYTYNRSLKKKLRELSEKFPQNVTFEREDGRGGETFLIPKKWIKVRAPRIVSEEEREKRAAVLKANFSKKSPAVIEKTGSELSGEYKDTTPGESSAEPPVRTGVFEEMEE